MSIEISIIASCLLTPIALGLISPIGTVKADVPVFDQIEENQENEQGEENPDSNAEELQPRTVREDVYYFRGY